MKSHSHIAWVLLAILLIGFPAIAQALGGSFYVGFATRVLILALAASSLRLLVGELALVSFGHAAFFGTGAFVVAILSKELTAPVGLLPGTDSAWIAWPIAVMVSALLAVVIGMISLRTKGAYFIMITLAFAQMTFYLFESLKMYGGDEGINMAHRSRLGFGLDTSDNVTFYYVILATVLLANLSFLFLIRSPLGRVMKGIKENETRMQALGYRTYRYKLMVFAIAGAVAGLSGALLANQNSYASPNLFSWLQSGNLLIMVILGGSVNFWGGAVGAIVFCVLEELLPHLTGYWQMAMGVFVILVVMRAPEGLTGLRLRLRVPHAAQGRSSSEVGNG